MEIWNVTVALCQELKRRSHCNEIGKNPILGSIGIPPNDSWYFFDMQNYRSIIVATVCCFTFVVVQSTSAQVGVGTPAPDGAEVLFDGTREMLDKKWTYWKGPRLKAELPIKWEIVDDPIDEGTAMSSKDPAAAGGLYGAADIVTKKKFRDFRLHVEFLAMEEGGNSGVYLQNRYEIQVLDGDSTAHGMAAVINEKASPYYPYHGTGRWNAYDIVLRAARFKDGKRVVNALVTLYFNGVKVHTNIPIEKVWGGPFSGIDGGNDNGYGVTDLPGGLKLQAEGHDIRYRNIWIQELDLDVADTDF